MEHLLGTEVNQVASVSWSWCTEALQGRSVQESLATHNTVQSASLLPPSAYTPNFSLPP